MTDNRQEERREVNEVQDKSTESGIRLNNILTGLILAAILWVGTSIDTMKDLIRINTSALEITKRDVSSVTSALQEHKLQGHWKHEK